MKSFITLVVLLMTMSFVSCTNDDSLMSSNPIERVTVFESDSLASLQAQISALNEKRGVSCPATRSWFSRLCRRVMADAVGGLFGNFFGGPAGAVAGAASFSALAAATESSCNQKFDNDISTKKHEGNRSLEDLVPEAINGKNYGLDSIGYYHNVLLLNTDSESKTVSEVPQVLIKEVRDSFPNLGTISSEDSTRIVLEVNNFYKAETKYRGGDDVDSYSDYLGQYYPNYKGEIGVVAEFLKGVTCTKTSVESKEYLGEVLKLVDDSKLSNGMKQNLCNSLIVGNASNLLWNEKKTNSNDPHLTTSYDGDTFGQFNEE